MCFHDLFVSQSLNGVYPMGLGGLAEYNNIRWQKKPWRTPEPLRHLIQLDYGSFAINGLVNVGSLKYQIIWVSH